MKCVGIREKYSEVPRVPGIMRDERMCMSGLGSQLKGYLPSYLYLVYIVFVSVGYHIVVDIFDISKYRHIELRYEYIVSWPPIPWRPRTFFFCIDT